MIIGHPEYVKTRSVCGYGAADTGFLTSGEEHTVIDGRIFSTITVVHTRQRQGSYLLSTLVNDYSQSLALDLVADAVIKKKTNHIPRTTRSC